MTHPVDQPVADATRVDHGALAPWQVAELPAPLPFSLCNVLRTIGPGAILLAGSIGGGEWIVGPLMTVKYGPGILWIATLSIVLQSLFNLEAVRYTLYTGEPITTGFLRLRPGPRVWGPFYVAIGCAQLATPALAKGCASVLFAGFVGRLDGSKDQLTVSLIATGLILGTVALLLSGKSIERTLERLSWGMIIFIFMFLCLVNVLFVPGNIWSQTIAGFLTPRALPENMDLVLFGLFAATAGSGGLGNLSISNLFRDKGFGMGSCVGGIGGALAHGHADVATVGKIFPVTTDNLSRWRRWWQYARIDQQGLWALGCFVGMFLNVNLALALIPPGREFSGYAAGTFQASYMAEQMWRGFWFLALLNGFWILFSTHLGNTDCLVRCVADIVWAGFPRVRGWSISRLYAAILLLLTVWALVSVHFGNVLELFKILGLVASPIMAFAAAQILRVNTRFLPPELRPPLWRRAGLLVATLFYGSITVALAIDLGRKWFG